MSVFEKVVEIEIERLRGCFTVGEKISKKLMINGELVIEWKKREKHKGCSCYD